VSGSRLALRLARREVRRRPGRTALVALLVAVPVAGMAMAVTLVRSDVVTPAQEWEHYHGQADAVGMSGEMGGADPASASVSLPDGSRTLASRSAHARVKTSTGDRASVEVVDQSLVDPLTEGIYDLVDGRAATKADEVVLSTATADKVHAEVGERLELERPDLTLTVVGEVERVSCLSCESLHLAPESPLLERFGAASTAEALVDLPAGLSPEELTALDQSGGGPLMVRDALAPQVIDSNAPDEVRWTLVIGAVALTVVGIVISAAFAVGARRQLVTLGQLSASGASPATVRTSLLLQGTVTGVVGALAGLGLAAVLLLLGRSVVEQNLDHRLDHYVVKTSDLAAVVTVGVVAATLAALLPARTAARIPTLAALAGRRPIAPVPRRMITWGIAAMLGGLGLLFVAVVGSQSGSSGDLWALVAIAGGVAELLGACALAPIIVARLEPLARRLRGSLRLGARSLARNRARTGAVVSAVAAASALAVAAGGFILGAERGGGQSSEIPDDVVVLSTESWDGNQPTVLEVSDSTRARVGEALPEAEEVPLLGVAPVAGGGWVVAPDAALDEASGGGFYPSGNTDRALIADGALLGAIRASAGVKAALEETGIVVLAPNELGGEARPTQITLPDGRLQSAAVVGHRYNAGYLSSILVSEDKAEELGLEPQRLATLFHNPEALSVDQRDTLEDVVFEPATDPSAQRSAPTSISWQDPETGPSPFQLELLLTAVALVFSLFVVGVSLALAAAESKDERDVLTIAGAPPGMLARSAGARAWLLAAIGAAMAVPIGFLPVVVFSWAKDRQVYDTDGFPIVFPTRTVLLLLVAVPLVVALVSWLTSATAQRLRPVRVSTASFE